MELLAISLAFVLGTLVGPFIWFVVIPRNIERATRMVEEGKDLRRLAESSTSTALAEFESALQQHKLAQQRYAEALKLNEDAQQLMKKVSAQTSEFIAAQKRTVNS